MQRRSAHYPCVGLQGLLSVRGNPSGVLVRITLPFAVLSMLVASPAAAEVAGSNQQAIINGDEVSTDIFPSAAQLIMGGIIQEQDIKAPSCTATLIAPDVVLTAGHCLDPFGLTFGLFELDNLAFWVTFEEDLSGMVGQSQGEPTELPDDAVEASGWVQHPGFDMDAFGAGVDGPGRFDDIALVFLETPITNRPHAYLPSAEEDGSIVEGQAVDIVGYGQQTQTDGPFDPPPDGTVNVRIHAESFINELAEFEMQIGDGPETSRKCHGDSGGPTYTQVETDLSNDVRVIGVTSHAYDERDCDVGGVDTRVGPYLEWIDDEMVRACDEGVRSDCDEPGILAPGEPAGDDDDDDDGSGCDSGCSAQGASSESPLALAVLAGVLGRRRRRSS